MSSTSFFKPGPGENKIRFLPHKDIYLKHKWEVHQHIIASNFHPPVHCELSPVTPATEMVQVPIYDHKERKTVMWTVRKELYDKIQNEQWWSVLQAIRSMRPSYFGLYDSFRDWVLEACERQAP